MPIEFCRFSITAEFLCFGGWSLASERFDDAVRTRRATPAANERFVDSPSAPDDAVRAFAAAYRRWAMDHPAGYDLTLRSVDRPERRTAGIGAVETMDAILAHYGLTDRDARRAGRALRASVHGFVTLEAADALGRGDHDASFDAAVALFLDGLHRRAEDD